MVLIGLVIGLVVLFFISRLSRLRILLIEKS